MNFKSILLKKGYTQKLLSSQLGITQQLISKWVKAQCEPQLDMLPKLAKALDISIEELVFIFINDRTV